MKKDNLSDLDLVRQITQDQWKPELEQASSRFHITIAWVAVILDPVFALTDYINIHDQWKSMLVIRISVSMITLASLLLRDKFKLSSHLIAAIPFLLISLQNAFVYRFIGVDHILGQNLNYMALLLGAGMFVLWRWEYSAVMILVSALATGFFLSLNPALSVNQFSVNGGLLLAAMGLFAGVLIQTRYNLVIKEIRARLALKASNEAIRLQAQEIKHINENLERLVHERTSELENKTRHLKTS